MVKFQLLQKTHKLKFIIVFDLKKFHFCLDEGHCCQSNLPLSRLSSSLSAVSLQGWINSYFEFFRFRQNMGVEHKLYKIWNGTYRIAFNGTRWKFGFHWILKFNLNLRIGIWTENFERTYLIYLFIYLYKGWGGGVWRPPL